MTEKNNKGFTLFEVIIVVVILAILSIIAISDFLFLQRRTDVDNGIQEYAGVLKLAQSKTLASENESQYGVHIAIPLTSPNKYVLFKGSSYVTRDTTYDQNYYLPKTLEFFDINLSYGSVAIVFDKLTGASNVSGSISIRSKIDSSQSKTVYIASSGTVGFELSLSISDTRLKDSRHLHFDYSRLINVNSENIILTFDNSITQIIPINAYLSAGEINWEGTVGVSGSNQTVKIHTHRLNNSDTQFSIHRDRRFNDKMLEVAISGDSSGNLAEYSADGLTTDYSSIYVSNFVWQ